MKENKKNYIYFSFLKYAFTINYSQDIETLKLHIILTTKPESEIFSRWREVWL